MLPEPSTLATGRDDDDLMVAVGLGDIGAFETIVDRYKRPLFNYLVRVIGDTVWAEDLVQETFLRVYRSRGSYRTQGRFRAWLYRIGLNLARDFLRREEHRSSLSLTSLRTSSDRPDGDRDPISSPTPTPAELVTGRELEERIEAAILTLPPKLRTVYVLCVVEGLSYEEAGSIVGCPVKTVSSRLSRARKRFLDIVEPYLSSG